jgi:hypothetical protein
MNLLQQEENLFQRVFSNLFPPTLGSIDDLADTHNYHIRTNRKGVDNLPGMAHGRVVEGSVKFKRIFYLPGRCV